MSNYSERVEQHEANSFMQPQRTNTALVSDARILQLKAWNSFWNIASRNIYEIKPISSYPISNARGQWSSARLVSHRSCVQVRVLSKLHTTPITTKTKHKYKNATVAPKFQVLSSRHQEFQNPYFLFFGIFSATGTKC